MKKNLFSISRINRTFICRHFTQFAPSKKIKREDLTLESMAFRITLGSDARKMSLWNP